MKSNDRPRKYRKDTLLTHLGRHPEAHHGAVNPPVYHASTILSSNMAEWEAKRYPGKRFDVVRYGLLGTPTTFALEEAVAAIEGGYRAMLMSSGLAAITAYKINGEQIFFPCQQSARELCQNASKK